MHIRPSQLTFLCSLLGYPCILRLLSGPQPSSLQLTSSIKSVSTLHSSLVTLIAIHVLTREQWRPTNDSSSPHVAPVVKGYPDDSSNPTIQGRSELANAITAVETGYLLQDTVILMLEAKLRSHGGAINVDKTMLTHHLGIGTALLILQYYIARGRERGIYIIVQFLLMNASTPMLNLRWYIKTYRPDWKRGRLVADSAFVAAFYSARVWLVGKILRDYGAFHGWGALDTFRYGLRLPCQLGTGSLWLANVGWWSVLVWNVVCRSQNLTLGGH